MKQQVVRKTIAGSWTEFKFAVKSRAFFVKNFTSGDIYVSFANDDDQDGAFKIKTGMGEEIYIASPRQDGYYVDAVYVKGTGEVEVQAIDF